MPSLARYLKPLLTSDFLWGTPPTKHTCWDHTGPSDGLLGQQLFQDNFLVKSTAGSHKPCTFVPQNSGSMNLPKTGSFCCGHSLLPLSLWPMSLLSHPWMYLDIIPNLVYNSACLATSGNTYGFTCAELGGKNSLNPLTPLPISLHGSPVHPQNQGWAY